MRQCHENNVFGASLLNSHILMNILTQYSDFINSTHAMITSTLHAKSDMVDIFPWIFHSCLKLSIPNIELIFSITSPSLPASPITNWGVILNPFPFVPLQTEQSSIYQSLWILSFLNPCAFTHYHCHYSGSRLLHLLNCSVLPYFFAFSLAFSYLFSVQHPECYCPCHFSSPECFSDRPFFSELSLSYLI